MTALLLALLAVDAAGQALWWEEGKASAISNSRFEIQEGSAKENGGRQTKEIELRAKHVGKEQEQARQSGQFEQARQKEEQEGRIRVEVNLVSVLASVTDASGRPIAELPREAFEIYEEGVKQKLELFEAETSQPLDLVLMMDLSMSTLKELDFIKEAAAHFARQVVRPGDRMAVYEFDTSVTQLSEFTSEVPKLQAAVRAAMPGAGTSLYDAVYLGSDALRERPAGRRRVIVLITDAGETTSDATFETARRAAVRSEALLYTILLRPVRNESGRNTAGEHALLTITDVTGGVIYQPDSSAELSEVFDRIDRELRTQYRLGYYPEPRPPAKSQRKIEVRVAAEKAGASVVKGFVVRHRKGYLTGPFE